MPRQGEEVVVHQLETDWAPRWPAAEGEAGAARGEPVTLSAKAVLRRAEAGEERLVSK